MAVVRHHWGEVELFCPRDGASVEPMTDLYAFKCPHCGKVVGFEESRGGMFYYDWAAGASWKSAQQRFDVEALKVFAPDA